MFGLDEWLAHSTESVTVFVLVISVLLGLRHATDPDHLSAMLTLRLRDDQKSPGRLGLAWGVGHAITMMIVGVPLIILVAELPGRLQQGLEFAVGVMIALLAVRAIWHALRISSHEHEHSHHGNTKHNHPHTHGTGEHSHRSPRQAFLVGFVHGAGGSAGVVALILGRLDNTAMAIVSLAVISVFSGFAMAACSWLMCRSLDGTVRKLGQKPVLLTGSFLTLAFGIWYCAAALEAAPYPF